jgi:hypothetical protein
VVAVEEHDGFVRRIHVSKFCQGSANHAVDEADGTVVMPAVLAGM